MGTFALILGLLGALCAIVGIVVTAEVLPDLPAAYTWEFWFMLATILFLAAIASALGRGGGSYE